MSATPVRYFEAATGNSPGAFPGCVLGTAKKSQSQLYAYYSVHCFLARGDTE